jgi:thioredoxin 1
MGAAITINDENFITEIQTHVGVALVDFGATWCAPCQALAPTIEELADDWADKGVKIAKCDIDEASDLAAQFGIMSVPTIVFFKDGEKMETLLGNQPKAALQSKIESLVAG